MMYVIYNSDGSIKKENINEFIQQSSNGVNEIAVQIEDYDVSDYVLTATFTLPDGSHPVIVADELTTSDEYPYPARKIALTDTITALKGVVRMNLQAIDGSTVLTSYSVYLQINDGVEEGSAVLITQDQYESLVGYYQSTLNSKANKVASATNGHLAKLNSSGDLVDSGFALTFEDYTIE